MVLMDLRILRLPSYKQFPSINLRSVCNSRPVRMWSGIKNINYSQILDDPLNEAATAPCVKAHWLFLISETRVQCQLLWEDAGTSCNTQLWATNKTNVFCRILCSLQCPLRTSLCSVIWRKDWNTGKRSAYSIWCKRRASCTQLANFVGVLMLAYD